jgi:hypothetical protein
MTNSRSRRVARYCGVALMGLMVASCATAQTATPKETATVPKKVLIIGNSYSDRIQNVLKKMVADSAHKDTTIQVVWGGGATLQKLIKNGRALKWIKKDKWDCVVLQGHSLAPALPGKSAKAFQESVDTLVKEARAIGATPVLYMTWGRREIGDRLKTHFKDYDAMQKTLSVAYRKAAKRNGIKVVPVGEAWSLVRKKNEKLGKLLYQEDGSHPSTKGAFLASCVFLRVLFGDSLKKIGAQDGVEPQEATLITDIVSGMSLATKATAP